jgi:hypothetical protein
MAPKNSSKKKPSTKVVRREPTTSMAPKKSSKKKPSTKVVRQEPTTSMAPKNSSKKKPSTKVVRREPRKPEELRVTAYHEAGHAVIGYRLGFDLGPVTIVPKGGSVGNCVGEPAWTDGSRDEDYVVSLFAGAAAGKRIDPIEGDRGCGDDNEKADELLRSHDDLNASELRQRAEDLTTKHWAEIEAVAGLLIEEETLPGDDVDFICDAVAESGAKWRDALTEYRDRRDTMALRSYPISQADLSQPPKLRFPALPADATVSLGVPSLTNSQDHTLPGDRQTEATD